MALSDRMRRRPVLVAAVVGALIVVVVGVGIAIFANPFAAKAPAAGQTTWQAITDKIRDGKASKDTALQAFAYLYQIDIPGVQVPTGVDGGDAPTSGTLVADWVQGNWDQLTPDQQAAINPYLQPGPNASVTSIDGRQLAVTGGLEIQSRQRKGPNDAPAQEVRDAFVNELRADVSHIGDRLGMTTIGTEVADEDDDDGSKLGIVFSELDGGLVDFETNGYDDPDYGFLPCWVTVYRDTWQVVQLTNGKLPPLLHTQITHEVVHCYQKAIWGSTLVSNLIPGWIKEGTAAWLAADDTKYLEPIVPSAWRIGYFGRPGRSLTDRTYDAYGYFALLDHVGRGLWSLMRPAWQAAAKAVGAGPDPSTAFIDVLHGDDSDVRDAWAPSYLRETTLTDPWVAYGFGLPNDAQVVRQPIGAPEAPGYLGEIDSRANAIDEVQSSSGEIVVIQTDGIANVHDTIGHASLVFTADRFCVLGDCICPPDTQQAGEHMADNQMQMPFVLAVNASKDGAKYRVVSRKLRDLCGDFEDDAYPPPNNQSGPPLCGAGCAGSNGDPHLRTVNNVYYEFQAAGEFTLLRSPDGSLDIQARQEPYEDSDHVSINTAIAAIDNGHRVGIYFDGATLTAHVDGSVVDATTPIDLGNGAQISEHERGFEIDFPDGTQLWALSHQSYGIDVQLRPSEGLRQDGVGLLGPVVPGGLAVPKLPDGSRLPRPTDAHQQYQLTYENLANAWRVTAATSLFDYDSGTSTTTYTVANFPSEQSTQTPADLTDEQRAAAAGPCAATTDLGLLEQCLFDVSITDDPGFGVVYETISDLLARGPGTLDEPIDGAPPPPTPSPGPPATQGPGATPVATPANALLTGLQSVKGSAVGPDGTVYLSVAYPDATYKLVAVDPAAGTVLNQVDAQGGGQLAVAAESVWVGEVMPDTTCAIVRFDASTLAEQATISTPCDFFGTTLASTGDAVWFVDQGLHRIDPATNTPGDPVALPFPNGFLYGTPTGLIYGEVSGGWYRLPVGQSELQSLGVHSVPVFAAGAGLWNQNQQTAEFFDSDGPAAQSIPIDGPLVSADDGAVYVEQSSTVDFTSELWRYPIDGSDPTRVAGVPEPYGDKTFSYFDNDPLLVAPGGLVKLWIAFASATQESALFVQPILTRP